MYQLVVVVPFSALPYLEVYVKLKHSHVLLAVCPLYFGLYSTVDRQNQ
jgi:hypothetical protein